MQNKLATLSVYIKYFLIFIFGVLGIILTSIFLRAICLGSTLNNIEKVNAAENNLYKITASSPLYKLTDKKESIILLPETYYVTLLSGDPSIDELVKVKYGTLTGFTPAVNLNQANSLPSSHKEYWESFATTKADSGTYLRSTPNTQNSTNILTTIPSNTAIKVIGSITGDTPLDGITNNWYLVDLELGPTTVTRGYIYAERITLETPLAKQQAKQEPTTTNATTSQGDAIAQTDPDATNTLGTINFSSGTKWFIIIMFSCLAVIIFALIISPTHQKKKDEAKTNTPKTRLKHTINNISQDRPSRKPDLFSPAFSTIPSQNTEENHIKTDQNKYGYNTKNRLKQDKNTKQISPKQTFTRKEKGKKPTAITPISPKKLPEFSQMLEYQDAETINRLSSTKKTSLPPTLARFFKAEE